MLQNNGCAGLLFLIGIFHNSLPFEAVPLKTARNTATAIPPGVDRAHVRAEYSDFNGRLVATGSPSSLNSHCLTSLHSIAFSLGYSA